MNRTKILNWLIQTFGYESYLEIGVYKPKRNFNHIKCRRKHGVDPNPKAGAEYVMTSDEFFATHQHHMYDLMFVDGLHTDAQSMKDVINGLERLSEGGTIAMHDCNPPTEQHQRPEKGKGGAWNGTVWKTFAELRMTRPDLEMFVVDCDWGVGIIRRGEQQVRPMMPLVWETLDKYRDGLLNLITPGEFKEWIREREATRD